MARIAEQEAKAISASGISRHEQETLRVGKPVLHDEVVHPGAKRKTERFAAQLGRKLQTFDGEQFVMVPRDMGRAT